MLSEEGCTRAMQAAARGLARLAKFQAPRRALKGRARWAPWGVPTLEPCEPKFSHNFALF